MAAGSDLVFDHLSHNHIEPRAEYQFFGDERLLFARGETVGGEYLFVDCMHQLSNESGFLPIADESSCFFV